MRKMILFFFMMMFRESECTDELREFFPLSFYFLEEEEDEIQQKYDTAIDEDVCTPCSTLWQGAMMLTTNQPKGSKLRVITHVMAKPMQASANQKRADRMRPCTSWPRPGINKLQMAAITFPLEPWP